MQEEKTSTKVAEMGKHGNNNENEMGVAEPSTWDSGIPVPQLRPMLASLLVFIVGVACFANSYDGQFVFDDSEAIEGNKDLLPTTSVWDLLNHDFWGNKLSNTSHKSYRPLTVLTFRWSYWLSGGLHPIGFHIPNILLHGVISALLLRVFDLIFSGPSPFRHGQFGSLNLSFLCALLFAVHPVHTESVSGIVGRADLLCALFFLLSFLCYVQGATQESPVCPSQFSSSWITLSLILCALATFSKEQGITVVGVCSAYDILSICRVDFGTLLGLKSSSPSYESNGHSSAVNGNESKKKSTSSSSTTWQTSLLKRHILLLGFAVFLLVIRWRVMGSSPPTFQVQDNPHSFVNGTLYRALNYNYLYAINVWILLSPNWLCFDWSMGCVPTVTSLSDPRLLAVGTLWAGLAVLAWACLCSDSIRYRRILTLGVALTIVPFIPASNLFFRVGFVVAERVLYLPSIGFCVLVGAGLARLCERPQWRQAVMVGFVAVLFVFAGRSVQRSDDWRQDMQLFKAGEKVCPLNAKVHYNIAKLNADNGNEEGAEEYYRQAIKLNPVYDQAMNNLANLLKDQGGELEAEMLLDKVIEINPKFAAAWMNRGIVKAALKKYEESEYSYLQGIRHRRNYPDCYYNLGNMYLEQKLHQKALSAFENATRLKPTHWNAWNNAIILLDNLQRYEQAINMAKTALKFVPDNPNILFNLGNIYGKTDQYAEGEKWFHKAIQLSPNTFSFHLNLGVLYHRWGKLKEAEKAYKESLRLNPKDQTTLTNLQLLQKKMKSAQ